MHINNVTFACSNRQPCGETRKKKPLYRCAGKAWLVACSSSKTLAITHNSSSPSSVQPQSYLSRNLASWWRCRCSHEVQFYRLVRLFLHGLCQPPYHLISLKLRLLAIVAYSVAVASRCLMRLLSTAFRDPDHPQFPSSKRQDLDQIYISSLYRLFTHVSTPLFAVNPSQVGV